MIPRRIITIRNSDETALIAGPITSGNDGKQTFNLDAGTYKIIILDSPEYQPKGAVNLVVTGTVDVTVELTPVASPDTDPWA